ncbi:hypothetical protein GCM10009605_02880 [Nocardiopsis composta]
MELRMTDAAGILLAAALGAVAVLHFLWAAGVYWPAGSEADLARKAAPDAEEIPGLLTALVAVLLAGAAHLALAANREGLRFVPDLLYRIGIWGLVAVMALRGLVEPFLSAGKGNAVYNRLDRRVYAPFCVVLALLGTVVAVG